jgi:hypothetical protein
MVAPHESNYLGIFIELGLHCFLAPFHDAVSTLALVDALWIPLAIR